MAQFEQGVIVRHGPLGHQEVTVSSAALGLPSLPTRSRIRRIMITPRLAGIIWTDDNTVPSAAHGQPLTKDSTLVYDGDLPDQFQMVRDGTTDADVRVAYHGL